MMTKTTTLTKIPTAYCLHNYFMPKIQCYEDKISFINGLLLCEQ